MVRRQDRVHEQLSERQIAIIHVRLLPPEYGPSAMTSQPLYLVSSRSIEGVVKVWLVLECIIEVVYEEVPYPTPI